MSGPSSKPKAQPPHVLVPHPDDADAVRLAFDDARRDDVLSVEESETYLRELLRDDEATRGR